MEHFSLRKNNLERNTIIYSIIILKDKEQLFINRPKYILLLI